ncbi:hypothetical protein GCM10012280_69060 [Wenjunlia tyrosinilytica]|uniref:Uncharacterized protein n=1 Tax=Wenjunlia tyrosinilytica TaxID=1544741 RepID=A0A918A0X9_9ACTN|nr:hypothetical protein GCM10012280_69060 [Wenjunlia tyrosinilytica]
MYVLLFPALMPFVLLGTVLGLSWLEDYMLPPTGPDQAAPPAPTSPPPAPALPAHPLPFERQEREPRERAGLTRTEGAAAAGAVQALISKGGDLDHGAAVPLGVLHDALQRVDPAQAYIQ